MRNRPRVVREFGPIALIALFAGVVTMIFATNAFARGAPNLDETAYRAQASALERGHLTLPGNYAPSFRPFLSGVRSDKVVFKYQPVWPALMALSRRGLGSTLPLRFALAVTGVLAVYALATEMFDERIVAIIAALIVALSPFVWVQAATELGYQLTLVTTTSAAWLLVRWTRRGRRAAAIGAGAALGVAVLHRPFDALIVLTPVLGWALWRAHRQNALLALCRDLALGVAPFLVLLLAYNQAVMGRPWRFAFGVSSAVDRFGFGWRASYAAPHGGHGGMIHYTVGRAFAAMWANAAALPRFVMAAPIVLAAAIYAVVRHWSAWQARLLVAMIAAIFAGYLLWWGTANAVSFGVHKTLGPFYHYTVLVPIAILAAWALVEVARKPRTIAVIVGVAVLWCIPASWNAFRNARHAGRTGAAELRKTDAPGRRLVFEAPPYAGDPYVLVDNRADLGGDRVVALDVPGQRLYVIDRLPDRTPYLERKYQRFGDFLGHLRSDRVRLDVLRAPRIEFTIRDRDASATHGYLAVGAARRNALPSRRDRVGAVVDLTAADLPADGRSTTVAVGLDTRAARGGPWVECRFEARATAGQVELLEPCDGYQHYVFPGGKEATEREDVTPRLSIDAAEG